jgi:exosome complex component RRP4
MMEDIPHLVLPGQLIASSSANSGGEDSFLRGHGTYVEETSSGQVELRAAVAGTVLRVNRLISVQPVALHSYHPQVGDLIVGRVTAIRNARWMVDVSGAGSAAAALPLSAVHLPGSVQRVRTAADALEMRQFIREGDLVSCEVHKIQSSTNVLLHTRSVRYGKLENGVMIAVPPKLVPRQKTHFTSIIENRFQILLGCNGVIWIQRSNNPLERGGDTGVVLGPQELTEAEEVRRSIHAETPYNNDDRQQLARLRNSIHCLRAVLASITPESVSKVYDRSSHMKVVDMLLPENAVKLTTAL